MNNDLENTNIEMPTLANAQPQPVVAPAPAPEPAPVVAPQPVVAPAPASEPAPVVQPQQPVVDQTVLNANPQPEAAAPAPKKENKKAEIIGTVVFLTVAAAIAVWWATSYLMLG